MFNERLSRRDILRGSAIAAAAAITPGFAGSIFGGDAIAGAATSTLNFSELKRVYDDKHHVAEGYNANVLVRWGDAMVPDAVEFDPAAQSAETQSRQFGYNNDFIAYLPPSTSPTAFSASTPMALAVHFPAPSSARPRVRRPPDPPSRRMARPCSSRSSIPARIPTTSTS